MVSVRDRLTAMGVTIPAGWRLEDATAVSHDGLVIAGYGSAAGGEEYSNTTVTVSVNGTRVGSFSTAVDCAPVP